MTKGASVCSRPAPLPQQQRPALCRRVRVQRGRLLVILLVVQPKVRPDHHRSFPTFLLLVHRRGAVSQRRHFDRRVPEFALPRGRLQPLECGPLPVRAVQGPPAAARRTQFADGPSIHVRGQIFSVTLRLS